MSNDEIIFSVIIPTFNREKSLDRAINSVLKQTFKKWELIVVDNFSNDNTINLINSFKSNKISFYQINNNGIIARSRNFGISKSLGKYVCFLDSDDWWDANKLKSVYDETVKGYCFIYHDHNLYSPNKIIKKRKIDTFNYKKPIFQNLLSFGPSFATSSVSIKKDIFKKINYFDERVNYIAWEDWNAWLKFSKINESFIRIQKKLATITSDGNNFLNDKLRIKNNNLFIEHYISKDQKIPNWCIYSNMKAQYNLKLNDELNSSLKIINFKKLNFFQKLRYLQVLLSKPN